MGSLMLPVRETLCGLFSGSAEMAQEWKHWRLENTAEGTDCSAGHCVGQSHYCLHVSDQMLQCSLVSVSQTRYLRMRSRVHTIVILSLHIHHALEGLLHARCSSRPSAGEGGVWPGDAELLGSMALNCC